MGKIVFAIAIAIAFTAAGTASAKSPRAFVKDAVQGDNSETMLGGIAERRGSSHAVRAYGKQLRQDHSAARVDAARVAARLGVPDTRAPMPEAAEERRKLAHLHGRAFDREFANYMVKDHHKDIAEFRQGVRLGGPAGDLARRTLPVLQRHLAMAERLQGNGD